MNKNIKYGLAAGLLTLTITSPFITETKVEAATCKLNKKSTTLKVGKTCNLKLNKCKKAIKWSSSDMNVATVSRNGKVTAKKKGSATICAKVNKKKYNCKVIVKKTSGSTQNNSNINPILGSLNTGTTNCPNLNNNSTNNNNNIATPKPETGNDSNTNSGSVTEASAYNTLNSLRSTYKEGTTLTNDYNYNSQVFGNGYGCYGFAAKLSDTLFGTTKSYTIHNTFDEIKVGDNIRIGNSHSVIVLTKDSSSITVVEGNYNSSIHWDRKITSSSLSSSGFTVYTRY